MISIGYIIGTSIAGILALVALIGAVMFLRARELDGADKLMSAGPCAAAFLVIVGLWLFTTWPSFDMDYHRYDPVSGVVEEVDRRLVADGDGMSEKVVLAVDGQECGCTDTRCALIAPGDTVELSCMRIWIYAGTDGFDCRYVAASRNS